MRKNCRRQKKGKDTGSENTRRERKESKEKLASNKEKRQREHYSQRKG
jgi:hypothetical protein